MGLPLTVMTDSDLNHVLSCHASSRSSQRPFGRAAGSAGGWLAFIVPPRGAAARVSPASDAAGCVLVVAAPVTGPGVRLPPRSLPATPLTRRSTHASSARQH